MSLINFQRGWPSKTLLPCSELQSASISVLADQDVCYDALLYGPDPGHEPLRRNIAEMTNKYFAPLDKDGKPFEVDEKRITITGGSSQSLACLLRAFTDPHVTQKIFMVSPTYFLACKIFEDAGFAGNLVSVPEDDDGVRTDIFEELLQSAERETCANLKPLKPSSNYPCIYKYVIYLVSTFGNPSGTTTSVARREELVRLARKYNVLLISDDVYDFLSWDRDTGIPSERGVPRLVDVDRALPGGSTFGNAVSNSSFSKLVGPGVRVGWIEGTPEFAHLASQVGCTKSGGAPSQFSSAIIDCLISTGVLTSLIRNKEIPIYARRREALLAAIDEYLVPLGVSYPDQPSVVGGYFVWITFPIGINTSHLAKVLKEQENVILAYGEMFSVWKDNSATAPDLSRYARLCWSWEIEDDLVKGIGKIASVTKQMLSI